jgi:LysM repeat protein
MMKTAYSIASVIVLLGATLTVGCSRSVKVLDDQEGRSKLIQKARAEESAGNKDSAIRLYKEALEKNPGLIRAHLDLALLLQDYAKDYVGAIYHYKRYMEWRPQTEKKEMIEEKIRLAENQFALAILRRYPSLAGGTIPPGTDIAVSRNERNSLSEQLEKTIRKDKTPSEQTIKSGKGVAGSSEQTTASIGRQPGRKYVVKNGDTLSSIASDVYQDKTKWRLIADANREALHGSDKVKVGQVLVIP